MNNNNRQHNPQLLLLALPAFILRDLKWAITSIQLTSNITMQTNAAEALPPATHIFACDHMALELTSRLKGHPFIIGIFQNADRQLLMSFFRNGGAAAMRYPWVTHELTKQLQCMFGQPIPPMPI